MNALKKTEVKASWFKTTLVLLITLMPIWFAPIRTAPVQSHLMAWATIVVAALIFCVLRTDSASQKLNNLVQYGIGGIIGAIGSAAVFWNVPANLDEEGKLVSVYFIAAINVWFVLTHSTEDGSVKWM